MLLLFSFGIYHGVFGKNMGFHVTPEFHHSLYLSAMSAVSRGLDRESCFRDDLNSRSLAHGLLSTFHIALRSSLDLFIILG